MADEDKEKAEKLAAAKKRFEQLKKEQHKKGKKGAGKKKDDKPGVDESSPEYAATEDPSTSAAAGEDEKPTAATPDEPQADGNAKAEQQLSPSVQSRQRSESFRQGSAEAKAGAGPTNAGQEVQELYKKQAARIEQLEKENKAVKAQQEEGATRLAHAEEELERLREGSSDMAELRSRAKEADKLSTELASVQRQLTHAQQVAKGSHRRASGASSDLSEQLASKTATIESLELELSNLRNQLYGQQNTLAERDASAQDMEEKIKAAETAAESYRQEVDQLKVSMAFPSDDTKAANEDPEALTKRITVLESDLRTANSSLDAAQKRASGLEQKIEALTKLHRDSIATNAGKDKELSDLRSQLRRRNHPSHVRDASEFELGDEETETGALHARIRALEAENFDLRRGAWREKRAEMQPGMDDNDFQGSGHPAEYEDVDLNAPYSPQGRNPARHGSTFQDVITSGISAFTGRPREHPHAHRGSPEHARKQSLGLLSDDGGLDEEAFRQAQEEEAKRRVERVKEVKRGLDKWKGWRVDLVEQRQQPGLFAGRGDVGPVFDV